MENLEWILSLAGAVLVFLSTAVGILVKLVKAVKAKNAEEIKNVLMEAAQEAVAFAETVKGVSGETKKNIALTQIGQTMLSKGMKFDKQSASEAVESLISLTKEVNSRAQKTETPEPIIRQYSSPPWI